MPDAVVRDNKMSLQQCSRRAFWRAAGDLRAAIASACLGALLLHSAAIHAQARCSKPAAVAASVQGRVEVQFAGESAWRPVGSGDAFCAGDTVRVRERSLAGLAFANEVEVKLRLDQNSVLTLGEAEPEKPSVMGLMRGWLHVITRHRRQFRVTTPVINAVVEGTEFTVSAGPDDPSVTVNEGRVHMQSPGGALTLESGQAGVVRETGKPPSFARVRPLDAVQWALYFPPVLRLRPGLTDSKPGQEAAKLALEGDATGALERVERIPDRSGSLRIFEASLLLSVGRADEARKILTTLPTSDDADGHALNAILQLIAGDRSQAAASAEAAVRAGPTAASLLAQSFIQQSQFKLDDALQSARRAAEIEPDNTIAWARLSELNLSTGDIASARRAAERAVELSPRFGRGHTMLGFVLLAQGGIEQARRSFDTAAAFSQGDPLPRLGRGLALIRTGALVEGRGELELAVLLDPGNSLLRSYLGKAYYDEKRDELAGTQFGLAQSLDVLDPTPWLYNAVRLQNVNRPGEALQEVQQSIARNENRAVYRSRPLLDHDQAVRSASLAQIYSDLGFDQLAVTEAMRALDADPLSFSAHRFLFDAYQRVPRFEIARVSELLQSQLRQPATAVPLPVSRGQTKAPVPEHFGPGYPSFQELSPLFNRDRDVFYLGGMGGSQSTLSHDLLYANVSGNRAFQIGTYGYDAGGFRPNNDLRQNVQAAMFQQDFGQGTSTQAEVRNSEQDNGDLRLQFDPQRFSPTLRQSEDLKSVRLGARHSAGPRSDWLVSIIGQQREAQRSETAAPVSGPIVADTSSSNDRRALSAELQHTRDVARTVLFIGGGHYRAEDELATSTRLYNGITGINVAPVQRTRASPETEHYNAYLYAITNPWRGFTATLGLSYDDLDNGAGLEKSSWNPKLGARWRPVENLSLQAAAFRTLKRPFTANQTIEPTQIAGFNQFFDDGLATEASRLAAGVDALWPSDVFAGMAVGRGKLDDVPILDAATRPSRFIDFEEQFHRAYLAWLPAPRWALSLEYWLESQKREIPAGFNDNLPREVKTRLTPVSLAYYDPAGWFFKLGATGLRQRVEAITGSPLVQSESTWLADALLGYRLPRRLGAVTVEARNLFDRKFNFFDTDLAGTPRVPLYLPERSVFLQLRLVL